MFDIPTQYKDLELMNASEVKHSQRLCYVAFMGTITSNAHMKDEQTITLSSMRTFISQLHKVRLSVCSRRLFSFRARISGLWWPRITQGSVCLPYLIFVCFFVGKLTVGSAFRLYASVSTRPRIAAAVSLKRPPLWSTGQSSWLQIQMSGFDSRRYKIF
jgi:hypothetical protein